MGKRIGLEILKNVMNSKLLSYGFWNIIVKIGQFVSLVCPNLQFLPLASSIHTYPVIPKSPTSKWFLIVYIDLTEIMYLFFVIYCHCNHSNFNDFLL